MSRHRHPLARHHRDAALIAPVLSDGPDATPDTPTPDAVVPAPRRPADDAVPGRHSAPPEPDAAGSAGRHRVPAPPADADEEDAATEDVAAEDLPADSRTATGAQTGGHHRGTAEAATTRSERAGRRRARETDAIGGRRRHRAGTTTVLTAVPDAADAATPAADPAEDATDGLPGSADTTVLAGSSRARPEADAGPRHHRRTGSRHAGTRPAGRRHAVMRGSSRRGGALVLVTVAAGLLALPTVSSASADQCRWQRAAHNLLVTLGTQNDDRSDALRAALTQAGVGPQLPAECAQRTSRASAAPTTQPSAPSTTTSATSVTSVTTAATRPTSTKPKATTTAAAPQATTDAPAANDGASAPVVAAATAGAGSTAAAAFGWGAAMKSDDFSGGLGGWGVYNGPGHGGNGRRTPDAAKVAGGILTITGDSNGNSAGMSWGSGQKYGRWEARVRSTPGDDSYHPVMLLWPDAENWPVGGEVDWMEISDANRQDSDGFLHYGASNKQVSGSVKVDATQWHNWAVEWTPQGITYYLDGKAWWSTKNTSILPPGPMHMTIQLDYFGGGNPKTSQMMVDWVHQYKM